MTARRRWLTGGALLGALLMTAGCASGPTVLEAARESCEAGRLGDEGHTLVLDMAGEDEGSGDLSYLEVICVLGELDAPDAMLDKLGSTRSLDGRQSDDWNGIEASWSYHPASGLDLILEVG
ncbi:hypothetical protein [Georgenia sp. MJ170]|uniref:hypothetical protein n=1 Tax=Georgenia sunbinii TaxID=3117728 RepID=UPI002F263998